VINARDPRRDKEEADRADPRNSRASVELTAKKYAVGVSAGECLIGFESF
jgi:hypothetical protein